MYVGVSELFGKAFIVLTLIPLFHAALETVGTINITELKREWNR